MSDLEAKAKKEQLAQGHKIRLTTTHPNDLSEDIAATLDGNHLETTVQPEEKKIFTENTYVAEFGYIESIGEQHSWKRGVNHPEFVKPPSYAAEFIKTHDTDAFRTVFEFKSWTFDPKMHVLGLLKAPFYIDFDSADLEVSLAEAKKYVSFLLEMKVPPDAIQVYYTGNKGFHVLVSEEIFNIQPHERQAKYYKEMFNIIRDSLQLTTVDPRLYHSNRMWRLAHTINRKSGRFKVQIPTSDFEKFNTQMVRDFGAALHPETIRPLNHQVQASSDLYQEAVKRVENSETRYGGITEEQREARIIQLTSKKPKPCITDALAGVDVSMRNDTSFILALHSKIKKIPFEQALQNLNGWNAKNEEPLPNGELDTTLRSVYGGKYHWSCTKVRSLGLRCVFLECPLSKTTEPTETTELTETTEPAKTPEPSPDIRAKALKLLEDPALLYHVHNATDDVVGEDENRVVLWLLAGISNPLQSVEIGGDSGSGKNRLADSVTKCFPPSWTEKYTTVSAKSIRYVENPIRTLYLAERPHKRDDEEESNTDLDIKLLISEPGGLTPLVTIIDPKTGRPKSVPIKTTIQNVIMTTTDVSCAVELENRVWSLITDNSPEQNRRVLDRQGWLASGLPSQRPDYDAPKPIIQEVAFMIDKEAPKRVTIPYAQIFIDWVLRLQSETRARRDYLKILDLIKAIARAHYKQNPKIYDPITKEDVIIATVEDFLQANRIGEKILTQTVTGINDRHMELYREACKLMDNHEVLTVKTLTERMKRVKKRISAATVRRGIDVLVDAGLLRSTGTTQTGGKPADVYERNLDLNDLKEKKEVRAPIELITEITESYRKWCITQGVEPKHRIPINPIDGKPIIIEKQENKPDGLSRFVNPRKLALHTRSKPFPNPQKRAASANITWEIRIPVSYQDCDAALSKMFLSIREPYSYRLIVKTRPRLSQQGRWYFDAELLETTDPKPERIIEGQHYPAIVGLVYTISVGNTDFITEFNQLLKAPENTGSLPGSLLVNAIIDINAGTLGEWGRGSYRILRRAQTLGQRLRKILSE